LCKRSSDGSRSAAPRRDETENGGQARTQRPVEDPRRGPTHGWLSAGESWTNRCMFLALVIAASVAGGEREGVKIVSPAIALYVSAFDKIVGNVAADRNEVCSLIVGYPWPYA
jgi:hypothetical protein